MGRNRVVAATAGLVAVLGALQSVQAQAPPPTVTVSPFSVARGWGISDKDGDAMAHELALRLIESGRYRVLDSAWLTGSGDSKRPMPAASLRAAASSAGVDYVIVGRLEKFTETYAVVQPGPRRLPPFGRPQMAWATAPPRTMTRRREFLRVTTEIVDAKSGEVLTVASTYCSPPSGSGLAKAASLALLPVSPVAATAAAAAGSRKSSGSSLKPALERALTSITSELLRWNPPSGPVVASGNR